MRPSEHFPPHNDKPDAKSGLSFCMRCGVAATRGRAGFCSPADHSLSGRPGHTAEGTEAHDEPPSLLKEGVQEASRVQSERSDLEGDLLTVIRWLRSLPTLDMEDTVADGGITAGMVVQHESKLMAGYIERYLNAPAPTGWRSIERNKDE